MGVELIFHRDACVGGRFLVKNGFVESRGSTEVLILILTKIEELKGSCCGEMTMYVRGDLSKGYRGPQQVIQRI
jgi:hypothetical protein